MRFAWRIFGPVLLTALLGGGPSARGGAEAEAPAWGFGGEVGGAMKIAALEELGLEWKVGATREGLVLRAQRPGLELTADLRPRADGSWAWELRRGEVDLGELWPVLRPALGEAAAGWSASGRVDLAGAGDWSAADGPRGEIRLALREGWARSDELEVELQGVELEAATRDLAAGTAPATQRLRIAKVEAAGAEIGAVELRFGVGPGGVLEVSGGEADFLAGKVKLRPFRMPLLEPSITAAAEVESLSLDEAARLVPWLLQTAQGWLRGRVELSWDPTKGLRVRDGGLVIAKDDGAVVRLTPSPGLLTGEMEPKFRLLPWRWARGIAIHNPAYAPLKDIEMGREGIRIDRFEVVFWPDGVGSGRTASIHIEGKPTSGKLVEEVKIDLHFHGPWSEFIAFGLNNEISGFNFRVDP
jgi:hypothetical protein